MNKGKKLTAVVAAAATTAAMVAPAFADTTASFTDIDGSYAKDAINALVAKGIIHGVDATHFNPTGQITRQDFAIILAGALGLDVSNAPATATFSDVPTSNYAFKYVEALHKAGVVSGVSATEFGFGQNITRQDMAAMYVRALGVDVTGKASSLTFADKGDIASYAQDAVGYAVSVGLFHGMDDTHFAPTANATREQVALVAQKFMDLVKPALSVTATATLNSDNTASVTGKVSGKADSVKVTVDGGAAVAATLNADGSYTFTSNVLASGSHTFSVVAYNGNDASQPASATVTVGTVGVASVKAVDATHVQVVFNTPMDTTDKNVADFAITANGVVGNLTNAVTWSADGKTATLSTLDTNPLVNNTYYTVTVKKTVLDANGNVLSTSADYNSGFLWNDTTLPAVSSVASGLGGTVVINFNKPLEVAPTTIALNGVAVPASAYSSFVAGDSSVTISSAWATANLTVGSTVNAIVAGAQDQADTDPVASGQQHNTMNLYQGSFTYNLNATTPVVKSLVASGEDQITLTFNEPIAQNVSGAGSTVDTTSTDPVATQTTANAAALGLLILNSDGTAVTPSSVTTTDGQTFTITVPNTVYLNGASTANLNVTVKGFEDAGNDVGNNTTQAVALSQDTTAPKLINSQYTTDGKIVFTFSKTLKAVTGAVLAGDLTIVNNATGVQTTPVTGVADVADGDKTVTIDNGTLNLAPGSYTFTFAAGSVTDQSNAGNTNAAFSQVVNVPSTTTATGPVVDSVTTPATDVITVNYSDQVKGGTQTGSATDVNNYKLNGQALPAGTTITLDSTQKLATIKLPSNSVSSSATEVISVANVQTLDGEAVAAYNNTVDLKDNVAPTLTAAKVNASGQLVLTFSEDVDGMTDEASPAAIPVADDFVVTVNGQTVTTNVAKGAAENQIILTSNGASFASGTVVVKTSTLKPALTGADTAGNTLVEGTTLTATR